MRTWYRQMDGLRFIAITMVLIEHFIYQYGKIIHAGYFGVDLFFVLSGFLITEGLLLNREEDMTQKKIITNFYIKRFLRIFPIYYLVLFIAWFTYPDFSEVAPWAFTYTVNYYEFFTGEYPPNAFSHLWSLSVEEQFYIFWPFLIIFIRSRKAVLFSILLVMAASLVYFTLYTNYVMLQARMFSLCFGGLLAYIKLYHSGFYSSNISRNSLIILVSAIILYFIQHNIALSVFSLMLVYLASNNAFTGIMKKMLEHPAVLYIGKVSYGIYLYHKPLGILITIYLFDPLWKSLDFSFFTALEFNSWIVKFPLFYGAAVGVAYLSYRFIEAPLLKLKKHLAADTQVARPAEAGK